LTPPNKPLHPTARLCRAAAAGREADVSKEAGSRDHATAKSPTQKGPRTMNNHHAMLSVLVLSTTVTVLGCGGAIHEASDAAKVATDNIHKTGEEIRKASELLAQGMDSVDPMALKEIFRALQSRTDKVQALEEANRKLAALVDEASKVKNFGDNYDMVVSCDGASPSQKYVAVSIDDNAPFYTGQCPITDEILVLPGELIGAGVHEFKVVFKASTGVPGNAAGRFYYAVRVKRVGHVLGHSMENPFGNCGGAGQFETHDAMMTCTFKDKIRLTYSPPK
jgi:aryl carrier-like protein